MDPAPRRPRWIFQLETGGSGGAVIRVLDTRTDTIFREIPIEEFLAYARHHRDVARFLLSRVTPNETGRPIP